MTGDADMKTLFIEAVEGGGAAHTEQLYEALLQNRHRSTIAPRLIASVAKSELRLSLGGDRSHGEDHTIEERKRSTFHAILRSGGEKPAIFLCAHAGESWQSVAERAESMYASLFCIQPADRIPSVIPAP